MRWRTACRFPARSWARGSIPASFSEGREGCWSVDMTVGLLSLVWRKGEVKDDELGWVVDLACAWWVLGMFG